MEWKVWFTVFLAVFVAELGDKTQLATMLFAADRGVDRFAIFIAASAALVCATAISVLAGGVISQLIGERVLKAVAALGFIGIGCWILWHG